MALQAADPKRVLYFNLQQLESNLKKAKPDDLYDLETQFQDLIFLGLRLLCERYHFKCRSSRGFDH